MQFFIENYPSVNLQLAKFSKKVLNFACLSDNSAQRERGSISSTDNVEILLTIKCFMLQVS